MKARRVYFVDAVIGDSVHWDVKRSKFCSPVIVPDEGPKDQINFFISVINMCRHQLLEREISSAHQNSPS